MEIHLITTDVSALALVEALPSTDRVTALIVPENRLNEPKIDKLISRSPWPYFIHRRAQPLPDNLPATQAGVVWLYSQIIAPQDLQRYPNGLLNMHGGKIPQYRGANVLQWAIINGESEIGITWHEIVAEVDAGPIWYETTIPVPPNATALDMRQAMITAGSATFPEAWSRFRERRIPPRYPDLATGRVWPSRRPQDSKIPDGLSEIAVRNMLRALCPPWPSPYLERDGHRISIGGVSRNPGGSALPYRCSDGTTLYLQPTKQ